MDKFAFIFSLENKCDVVTGRNSIKNSDSSVAEKMAIVLAKSIREHHPTVDIYCGSYTSHRLSLLARAWLENIGVKIHENVIFKNTHLFYNTMFLRSYTKHYFGKLLDQYDYLIYMDIDSLLLKPVKFNFDPREPIVVVDSMPEWVKNFQRTYTNIPEGNLYYNWMDVINSHNVEIYNLDYSKKMLLEHNADIEVTRRIDSSNLKIIDQDFGGYACFKPVNKNSIAYHYDEVGAEGTFFNLKDSHPDIFLKYKLIFERVFGIEVKDNTGYWEKIMKEYS